MANNESVRKTSRLSLHNHFLYNKGYDIKDIIDCAIDKGIDILSIDGWESPDIITRPYVSLTRDLEKKEDFKSIYEIVYFDNLLLRVLNKESGGELSVVNSLEVETTQGDVGFFGYDGNIKHGLSLEETVEHGIEQGSFVNVLHPFIVENKIHKFWSDERFISMAKTMILYNLFEKFQGKVSIEKFNSFLHPFIPKIFDMSEANERAEKFFNIAQRYMKIKAVNGNDSHVKAKELIEDCSTVYQDVENVDNSNSKVLIYSVKDSVFQGKYILSEKRYIPKINFLIGFDLPDYAKKIGKNLLKNKKQK